MPERTRSRRHQWTDAEGALADGRRSRYLGSWTPAGRPVVTDDASVADADDGGLRTAGRARGSVTPRHRSAGRPATAGTRCDGGARSHGRLAGPRHELRSETPAHSDPRGPATSARPGHRRAPADRRTLVSTRHAIRRRDSARPRSRRDRAHAARPGLGPRTGPGGDHGDGDRREVPRASGAQRQAAETAEPGGAGSESGAGPRAARPGAAPRGAVRERLAGRPRCPGRRRSRRRPAAAPRCRSRSRPRRTRAGGCRSPRRTPGRGCRAGPASPAPTPGTRRSPPRPGSAGLAVTASGPSTCSAAADSSAVLDGSFTVGGTLRW